MEEGDYYRSEISRLSWGQEKLQGNRSGLIAKKREDEVVLEVAVLADGIGHLGDLEQSKDQLDLEELTPSKGQDDNATKGEADGSKEVVDRKQEVDQVLYGRGLLCNESEPVLGDALPKLEADNVSRSVWGKLKPFGIPTKLYTVAHFFSIPKGNRRVFVAIVIAFPCLRVLQPLHLKNYTTWSSNCRFFISGLPARIRMAG